MNRNERPSTLEDTNLNSFAGGSMNLKSRFLNHTNSPQTKSRRTLSEKLKCQNIQRGSSVSVRDPISEAFSRILNPSTKPDTPQKFEIRLPDSHRNTLEYPSNNIFEATKSPSLEALDFSFCLPSPSVEYIEKRPINRISEEPSHQAETNMSLKSQRDFVSTSNSGLEKLSQSNEPDIILEAMLKIRAEKNSLQHRLAEMSEILRQKESEIVDKASQIKTVKAKCDKLKAVLKELEQDQQNASRSLYQWGSHIEGLGNETKANRVTLNQTQESLKQQQKDVFSFREMAAELSDAVSSSKCKYNQLQEDIANKDALLRSERLKSQSLEHKVKDLEQKVLNIDARSKNEVRCGMDDILKKLNVFEHVIQSIDRFVSQHGPLDEKISREDIIAPVFEFGSRGFGEILGSIKVLTATITVFADHVFRSFDERSSAILAETNSLNSFMRAFYEEMDFAREKGESANQEIERIRKKEEESAVRFIKITQEKDAYIARVLKEKAALEEQISEMKGEMLALEKSNKELSVIEAAEKKNMVSPIERVKDLVSFRMSELNGLIMEQKKALEEHRTLLEDRLAQQIKTYETHLHNGEISHASSIDMLRAENDGLRSKLSKATSDQIEERGGWDITKENKSKSDFKETPSSGSISGRFGEEDNKFSQSNFTSLAEDSLDSAGQNLLDLTTKDPLSSSLPIADVDCQRSGFSPIGYKKRPRASEIDLNYAPHSLPIRCHEQLKNNKKLKKR